MHGITNYFLTESWYLKRVFKNYKLSKRMEGGNYWGKKKKRSIIVLKTLQHRCPEF